MHNQNRALNGLIPLAFQKSQREHCRGVDSNIIGVSFLFAANLQDNFYESNLKLIP